MIDKIAVLGAGNGGHAFAAHLTLKGFEVNLYEAPDFRENIEPIREKGGIEAFGDICGFADISNVSTHMGETVKGVDLIIIPVPAFAQDHMINECLPYLEEGQIILFCPDNAGSIRFYNLLKEEGLEDKVTLAGMACLLYLTKRIGPAQIDIAGVKHEMRVSTMPGNKTEEVVNKLKEVYDGFKPGTNPLTIFLNNTNLQCHPGPLILNTGRVESNQEFKYYQEGVTNSINSVIEEVEEERLKIGRAIGLRLPTIEEIFEEYYRGRYSKNPENVKDIVTTNVVYRGAIAPSKMTSRFITEDVTFGLMLMSDIGNQFNVPTPTIDSLIHLASVLNEDNYREKGLTLEKLELGGMDKSEIIEYLKEG